MSNGAMRYKVREKGKVLEPTQRGKWEKIILFKLVISCFRYFLLLLSATFMAQPKVLKKTER